MSEIVYSCPFVPAELIAAHGLTPRRIVPAAPGGPPSPGLTSGVCPFVQGFLNEMVADRSARAVVLTTVCDQMRRAAEILERDRPMLDLFQFNVPATWQTAVAHQFYRQELTRLGLFLVRQGGRTPADEDLVRVMLEYDTAREELRDARGRYAPRQIAEAMLEFYRTGAVALPPAVIPPETGVPVALVGGPLTERDLALYDLVERAGGMVVLDATETGERTLPAPLARRELGGDPLEELVRIYFGSIPDAFRRPNSELYRYLQRELADREVRGIIYRRGLWCDTWNAEARRLKEWVVLPMLELGYFEDEGGEELLAGRVQAFMETLGER